MGIYTSFAELATDARLIVLNCIASNPSALSPLRQLCASFSTRLESELSSCEAEPDIQATLNQLQRVARKQLQEAESGLRKKEEIRQARLAQSVAQAAKTAATRAAAAPPTTSARPTLAASTSGRSRINRTFISAFGMAPVSGQAVSSTLAASTTNTAAQSEALARARVLPLRGGWVETNFSKTTQNVLISATKQAQAMDAEAKIGDTATKFEAERQKLLSYISPAALLFSSSDVTIDTLSTATSETTDSCLRIVLPKKGARVNAASVSVSSSNMYFADPLTRSVAVHAADTSFVALTPTIGETAQVAMIARLPAFDALRKPIQTYANVEDHSVEANKTGANILELQLRSLGDNTTPFHYAPAAELVDSHLPPQGSYSTWLPMPIFVASQLPGALPMAFRSFLRTQFHTLGHIDTATDQFTPALEDSSSGTMLHGHIAVLRRIRFRILPSSRLFSQKLRHTSITLIAIESSLLSGPDDVSPDADLRWLQWSSDWTSACREWSGLAQHPALELASRCGGLDYVVPGIDAIGMSMAQYRMFSNWLSLLCPAQLGQLDRNLDDDIGSLRRDAHPLGLLLELDSRSDKNYLDMVALTAGLSVSRPLQTLRWIHGGYYSAITVSATIIPSITLHIVQLEL